MPNDSRCITSSLCWSGFGMLLLGKTQKKHPGHLPPTVLDLPPPPRGWHPIRTKPGSFIPKVLFQWSKNIKGNPLQGNPLTHVHLEKAIKWTWMRKRNEMSGRPAAVTVPRMGSGAAMRPVHLLIPVFTYLLTYILFLLTSLLIYFLQNSPISYSGRR